MPALEQADWVHWHRRVANVGLAYGLRVEGLPSADKTYDRIWLVPDRQRDRQMADVADALARLKPGGILVVSLPNDWGAKRLQLKLEEAAGGKLVGYLSKHHCRVLWMSGELPWDQAELESWRKAGAMQRLPDTQRWSQPGLFSWDRMDLGSLLLVKHMPDTLAGKVADLGCGWGYLSEQVMKRCEAVESLDAFDADARALEPTRRNLGNVLVPLRPKQHWVDVTEGVGVRRFDVVVMNPPFHEGRDADSTLGMRFIVAAAAALKDDGQLWMVANRNLPYEGVLTELFADVRQVASDDGFKVLQASYPHESSRPKVMPYRGKRRR